MAKALGTTPEEEHKLGLSKLASVRLWNAFEIILPFANKTI